MISLISMYFGNFIYGKVFLSLYSIFEKQDGHPRIKQNKNWRMQNKITFNFTVKLIVYAMREKIYMLAVLSALSLGHGFAQGKRKPNVDHQDR